MTISELQAIEEKMSRMRKIFKAISKQIQEIKLREDTLGDLDILNLKYHDRLRRMVVEEGIPIITPRTTNTICNDCGGKAILIKYTFPNKIPIKRYMCIYCKTTLR